MSGMILDPVTEEVRDRLRRVESRIVKIMEHMQVETGAMKPQFKHNAIVIPSMGVSLADMLRVIERYDVAHTVMHKGNFVGYLTRSSGFKLEKE